MKQIILFFILTTTLFSQVDSMRITWTDPTDSDLDSLRLYADTVATPTTYRANIDEGVEAYEWKPPYGGLWRVGLKAVDDSSNLSVLSSIDTVTIWRDSIPSQFTFYDSTDAAVSSQIITRSGVVLSGFDSAQVTVTGGDYRLGALLTWTRSPSFASTGDTLWAVDTSSASNSTKTDVRVAIAGVVDTFSVTTESGGVAYHVSDSLRIWYSDSTLSLGSVTTWEDIDDVYDLQLWSGDTSYRPIMSANGVVYAADDWMYDNAPTNLDSAISMEIIIKIADTTLGVVFGGIGSGNKLNMGTLSNEFGTRTFDGSNTTNTRFYAAPFYNQTCHLVVTWAGGTASTKFYVNGVEQTARVSGGIYSIESGYVSLGSDGQGDRRVPAGTIIRAGAFYSKVLTAEEVTQNYEYYQDTGQVP